MDASHPPSLLRPRDLPQEIVVVAQQDDWIRDNDPLPNPQRQWQYGSFHSQRQKAALLRRNVDSCGSEEDSDEWMDLVEEEEEEDDEEKATITNNDREDERTKDSSTKRAPRQFGKSSVSNLFRQTIGLLDLAHSFTTFHFHCSKADDNRPLQRTLQQQKNHTIVDRDLKLRQSSTEPLSITSKTPSETMSSAKSASELRKPSLVVKRQTVWFLLIFVLLCLARMCALYNLNNSATLAGQVSKKSTPKSIRDEFQPSQTNSVAALLESSQNKSLALSLSSGIFHSHASHSLRTSVQSFPHATSISQHLEHVRLAHSSTSNFGPLQSSDEADHWLETRGVISQDQARYTREIFSSLPLLLPRKKNSSGFRRPAFLIKPGARRIKYSQDIMDDKKYASWANTCLARSSGLYGTSPWIRTGMSSRTEEQPTASLA
ncbi:hypothetical protein ACA910_003773 [Epithemia clementina (nom. ined.)]